MVVEPSLIIARAVFLVALLLTSIITTTFLLRLVGGSASPMAGKK